MINTTMISPWAEYYRKIQAFFKYDCAVNVIYDEAAPEIKIYVNNNAPKADALTQLLPETKEFGNVTLRITIVPTNGDTGIDPNYRYGSGYRRRQYIISDSFSSENKSRSVRDLFFDALNGNDAFSFGNVIHLQTNDVIYFVFKNEVVQYYNDDLGDYFGQCSTLYQNLAADIFKPASNVHFCTDKPRYGE